MKVIAAIILLTGCANKPQQPTVIAIQHGKDITSVVIPPPPPTNILTSLFGDSVISTLGQLFGL